MVRRWLLGASLLSVWLPMAVSGQDQAVQGAPRGGPARWLSDLDYPADAKRVGAQGSVSVALSVDAAGYVTACRVIASSGNDALDRMTCTLLQRRARFTVPKDAAGAPQPFTYEMTKVWKL